MHLVRYFDKRIRGIGGLLLLCFLPALVYAQQESSYRFYEPSFSVSPADTARINRMIRESSRYYPKHMDSIMLQLEAAKKESIDKRYLRGMAHTLIQTGHYYAEQHEKEKAIAVLWEALPYCYMVPINEKEKIISEWYAAMAKVHMFSIDHDSAIIYLRKAEYHALTIKDTSQLIKIYFNMGSVWLDNFQEDNAVYYLKRAERLAMLTNDTPKLCRIYNNLANVFSVLGDTEKIGISGYYASKALAIGKKEALPEEQEASLLLLGYYAFRKNELDQAVEYFQQSMKLATGRNRSRYSALMGLSRVFSKRGSFSEAEKYALSARAAFPAWASKPTVSYSHYKHLADLNARKGDFESAYKYQVAYSRISDSLNSTERNKALDKLETQSKIAEKDKELIHKEMLLVNEKNKLKNRNIWIAASSIGILSIGILFLSFYINSRRRIHIMKQQEEINKLKAVMNGEEKERTRIARELHDGIGGLLSAAAINLNTLGDVHALLISDPVYRKMEMLLDTISNEVRKTAHNLTPDVLLRYDLPEAVRLFCSYMQKGNNLEITILTNGSFEQMKQDFLLSAYRIIQELVQNILKHAQAQNAFVQLHTDETIMSITVEDDGKGYDPNAPSSGMGLRNILARVESLSGNINIESSSDKGTSVYIEFDIKSNTV